MKRPFFALHGHRPLERAIRGVLLLGVFALVVVAFQKHFDAVIERVDATGTLADRANVLTAADRTWVLDLAQKLRARYGLSLCVRIGGQAPDTTAAGPETALLYVDPDCRASRAVLAPLAASALPAGFLDDLGREHLDAACREGRLRAGVLASLGLLSETLDQAAGRGKGATHE